MDKLKIMLSGPLETELKLAIAQRKKDHFDVMQAAMEEKSGSDKEWEQLQQSAMLIADEILDYKIDKDVTITEIENLISNVEELKSIDTKKTEIYQKIAQNEVINNNFSDEAIFLSNDSLLNSIVQEQPGKISANKILAGLAISGISTNLPAISFQHIDDLHTIRERFAEERIEYVNYLRDFIKDCHEGIQNSLYESVFDFAEYNTNHKLKSRLDKFESAVKKSDRRMLSRIGVGITSGIPEIVRAWVSPNKSWTQEAGAQLLKTFFKGLTERNTRKEARENMPEITYIYNLKKSSVIPKK